MIKIFTGHNFNRQLIEEFHSEYDNCDHDIKYDIHNYHYVDAAKRFFELPEELTPEGTTDFISVVSLLNLIDYKNKKIQWSNPLIRSHPIFQAKFARLMCELHKRNGHSFNILTNESALFNEILRCIILGIISHTDVHIQYYWKYCIDVPILKNGDIDRSKFNDSKFFDVGITFDQVTTMAYNSVEKQTCKYSLLDCILDGKKVDIRSDDCIFGHYSLH